MCIVYVCVCVCDCVCLLHWETPSPICSLRLQRLFGLLDTAKDGRNAHASNHLACLPCTVQAHRACVDGMQVAIVPHCRCPPHNHQTTPSGPQSPSAGAAVHYHHNMAHGRWGAVAANHSLSLHNPRAHTAIPYLTAVPRPYLVNLVEGHDLGGSPCLCQHLRKAQITWLGQKALRSVEACLQRKYCVPRLGGSGLAC